MRPNVKPAPTSESSPRQPAAAGRLESGATLREVGAGVTLTEAQLREAALPRGLVRHRFAVSVLFALVWAGVSAYISRAWFGDLGSLIGEPLAIAVIAGIAIVPGYLNAQLVAVIFMDKPRPLPLEGFDFPPLTILIAAFDEERSIGETLAYARNQDYPAELRIVVIDDGSHDHTPRIVEQATQSDGRVSLVRGQHGGKAVALNLALKDVKTPLVATVDADTLLMPQTLRRAVARLLCSPPETEAVAGDVLVRNSRDNLLTRMQDWDYTLGIASVKRQQSLVTGTLVAQGSFSVYNTRVIKRAGGWPDMIGEDIVLTWSLLNHGGGVAYEPTAVAYTEVPVRMRDFLRQRRRWARGMVEGLRSYGVPIVRHHTLRSYAVGVNWGFPYLDAVFTLAWIPGLILAFTGNFAIVGPMTLAVLPVNAAMACIMLMRQRQALHTVDRRIRRNAGGFLAYFFFYQLIMSPVSLSGYIAEAFHRRRNW